MLFGFPLLKVLQKHLLIPVEHWPMFLLAALILIGLFVGVFAALHRLSPRAKKWMTISCTFIAGLYFLLIFLLPTKLVDGEYQNKLGTTVPKVTDYVNHIFIWTIFLGLISLAVVHGRKLFRRQPGWHNSLAFFIAFFAFIVAGAWSQAGASDNINAKHFYDSLFGGLLANLDASMFALLAFYIASASYRAFRIRTVESALLMIAAIIVMLGMVNFGVAITNAISVDSNWAFLRIERMSTSLLTVINMPAQRAIMIGVAIGSLAMAMRLWLSLERGTFFSEEN